MHPARMAIVRRRQGRITRARPCSRPIVVVVACAGVTVVGTFVGLSAVPVTVFVTKPASASELVTVYVVVKLREAPGIS